MFDRTALKHMNDWADRPDRKPLVLRGARQVGKTTLVNLFSTRFDQYIYLNLDLAEDRRIIEQEIAFNRIIDSIFLNKDQPHVKSANVLLFLDEIQNSPRAVSLLRYFYEMAGELYVIAAGSLLESAIDRHISFPVGRVEYLAIRPCSFHEFLVAMNETHSLDVLSEFPFPDYAHDKLMDLFHLYTLIGGMPAVIEKYSNTRDIVSLEILFESLVNSFLDDIENYSRNQAMARVIRHVMEQSFYFTGARITFQGFGKSNYRSREVGEAFRMIEKAMLLQLVYPVTTVTPPVIPDHRKSPKLQFVDVGLINYRCGLQKELFGTPSIDTIYQGRIAEQIVAQELLSLSTSVSAKNYFWIREKHQSSAEVDFIYPHREYIIPIEVKAGKAGILRSIHQFVQTAPHPFAVRIYSGKLSVNRQRTADGTNYMLLNLPFYLVHKMDTYLEWLINEQI